MIKKALDFLRELQLNNNREWFAQHKDEYKAVQSDINLFTEQLIDGIASFDDSVRGLTAKDCTYRIYRDTRFSNNKLPYKSHIGIYVCPGGKKSGNAGYYFHIEPKPEGGGMFFITAGIYMPESNVLRSVREEICYNGELFLENIKKAKGFRLGAENALKRIPAGFPADSPYVDYLKLKDVYLEKALTEESLLSSELLKEIVTSLSTTYDFMMQLNKAVEYAREEM